MDRTINISKLLEGSKARVIFSEDLGTLKAINPVLAKDLGIGGAKWSSLEKGLGRESELKTSGATMKIEAYRAFKPGVKAVVVVVNGNQLGIIMKSGSRHGSEYESSVDQDMIEKTFPELTDDEKNNLFHDYGSRNPADNLLSYLRRNKIGYEVMTVEEDKQRAIKHAEREKARSGATALKSDKELKDEFMDRVDQYKSSKAKEFTTPEELVSGIKDSGYFNKVKYMGQTYDLYQDRIDFKAMTGSSSSFHDESYMQYMINKSTTEYKTARDEYDKNYDVVAGIMKEKGKDDPDYVKARDELADTVPPEEVKIMLKLEGGSIVPHEIKTVSRGYMF